MLKRNKYNRYFIMLNESQQGFGRDGKPTGYVRIEIKNDVVKVLVHTQNLISIDRDKSLDAYLLSSNNKDASPFNLGKLATSNNGGDLIYGFTAKDLVKAGQDIDSIDTAVITLKRTDGSGEELSFPLAGFKNIPWDYKRVFSAKKSIVNKNTDEALSLNEKTIEKSKEYESVKIQEEDKVNKAEERDKNKSYADENRASSTDKQATGTKSSLTGYPTCKRPFACGDLGYNWHYINNLKFILENEYSNEGIMYLMYNYNVMNAVYRYNHFLFGVDNCNNNFVKRISFAVPARYAIEPNPLIYAQAYTRWIPRRGENTVAGALGYWVVVIDVQNGCFTI